MKNHINEVLFISKDNALYYIISSPYACRTESIFIKDKGYQIPSTSVLKDIFMNEPVEYGIYISEWINSVKVKVVNKWRWDKPSLVHDPDNILIYEDPEPHTVNATNMKVVRTRKLTKEELYINRGKINSAKCGI